MTKEGISNNLYYSSPISTTSAPLRWMPRFICKSSPLTCRKSTPTFSVASITKVHTFGKLKQQHSMDSTSGSTLANSNCTHQTRQRHHFDISSVETILSKLPVELIQDILMRLDCMSLYQLSLSCSAFRHLLSKTTMIWHTLMVDSNSPLNPLELYKMICFMVTNGIHVHVDSLVLDRCAFLDPVLLDTLIRAYPNLVKLSLVECPQIGCWQILYMLRASIKGNHQLAMLAEQHEGNQQLPIDNSTDDQSIILLAALKATKQPQQQQQQKAILFTKSGTYSSSTRGHHHHTQTTENNHNHCRNDLLPCLKHLERLDMEGAFPSERSHKSHTHEMYCFGEIKKALLQLGHHHHDMPPMYQQLSEAHYALYQFWLLLRSHMLRWDSQGQETQQHHPWQDFRPPWLPDTLVQFIQITEQDHPLSSVKIDLVPCPLCHRNVAPPSQYTQPLCYACQLPTPMVCAQCRCHSCHAVLCSRCHHVHQARFRQSTSHQLPMAPSTSPTTTTTTTATSTATAIYTTTAAATTTDGVNDIILPLSSWRTLHCQQCHLPRRICGQPSCVEQLENNKNHRWTCTSCQQQQKWTKQREIPQRFFKKSRHWSHWI